MGCTVLGHVDGDKHRAALARIAELEAALASYADPDVYFFRGRSGELPPRVIIDGGSIARTVLGPKWEEIEADVMPE